MAAWLPLAEFWYNNNFHSSLKIFPFQALLYGYKPLLIITSNYLKDINTKAAAVLNQRKLITDLVKTKLCVFEKELEIGKQVLWTIPDPRVLARLPTNWNYLLHSRFTLPDLPATLPDGTFQVYLIVVLKKRTIKRENIMSIKSLSIGIIHHLMVRLLGRTITTNGRSLTWNIKTKKIFVTGLSFYTSEKTLRAAFDVFGELIEVKIIMDKISKRSKGYAFIEYTTEEAASTALREMNGKIINGWMITVDVAKKNPPKYGRGRPG
ncbi:hypothetical protein LIER_06063 [Lithospermum erythrorhizon]|uniref:RRM domain-containing protein n=1 Tax=Lithospermum erythrorhizon TaxID=34254 RepID=A0AAV3P7L1_LITER